jgi:hypothetical protein
VVSGPGNAKHRPDAGDTAVVNNATIAAGVDSTLSGNTLFLTGTTTLDFTGDTIGTGSGGNAGISLANPTIDGASLISNDPPASPASTTLNFAGYTVSQGTIVSDGAAGSSLTVNITQDGTAPGFFLNYGNIEADTGNSVTIAVAGTSELFNAGLVYANGGSVLINGGTGVAGGYAPMLGGIALVGGGGTLELNAGFPAGTAGASPIFAFYDGDSGDTLKLDQIKQFGGRILGFARGDTIDLGGSLSVGTIAVSADGQVRLENHAGTTIATLVLSSGTYTPGTFAVAGGIADGFTLTAGADGDTLLTTNVIDSVWNNASGTWQTAADWSTGAVAGANDTAVIGINPTGVATGTIPPFVVTTGSAPVDAGSLIEANGNATLDISSNTTVGIGVNSYGVQQIAGTIEVTGGNTLTTPFLRQDSAGADLLVDAGGVLAIIGHSDLGFANNGTLTSTTVVNGTIFPTGDTIGLFVQGTATVDGGAIDAGLVLSGSSVASTGGFISIGQSGAGTPSTMTVNGGSVTDTFSFLSSDPTSFGALTLTNSAVWDDAGAASGTIDTDPLNTRGYMLVGFDNQSGNQPSPPPSGTAQLVVENSAALNEANYAEIGQSADSAGSATIASGGVWNIGTSAADGGTGGFLSVGNSGSGTLVIDDGTVNILAGTGTFTNNGTIGVGEGLGIAHRVGSDGTVFVSGGGQLNIANTDSSVGGFGVGQLGHGLLDIFSGGTVTDTNGGISAGSTATVVGGATVIGDGTIVVGGTFDAGGTVENTGSNSLLISTAGMSIGKLGTGTLFVTTGGTVKVSGGGINVGNSVGAFGFVEINGGLVTDSTSGLNVGNFGDGTLDLNSGTVSVHGGISVGTSSGATGRIDVTGGLLSSTNGGLNVGNSGTGFLSVNGGTVSVASGMGIGLAGTGFATIAHGLVTEGAALVVGDTGTGTLAVGSLGTVSAASGVSIGLGATGTGKIVVNGGTLDDGGIFNVGVAGAGTLVVQGGGIVEQTGVNFFVGGSAGSHGTVVVNGGTLETSGTFAVGGTNASGSLLVEGGGLLSTAGFGGVDVNATGTGQAAATVSGGTWTVAGGNLVVGGNGSGSLDINGGGSVGVVNAGANEIVIGQGGPAAHGTISVENGGTLLGGALALSDAVGASTGRLTVGGGGTVEVSGVAESAGGAITVGGGTVAAVLHDSGLFTLGLIGTDALLTVNSLGTVSGAGANTLQIQSNSTALVNGGVLSGFGTVDIGGVSNGTLIVTGGGTLEGAQVEVKNGGLLQADRVTVDSLITQGSIGTLSIGSGGSLLAGIVVVGNQGSGPAVMTVGSLGVATVTGGVSLGDAGAGAGTLIVNGGGTLLAGGFDVGAEAFPGTAVSMLTVNSGGFVSQTASNTFLIGDGGFGIVTVDGGTLDIGSNSLLIGKQSSSDGTLIVENGGTLSAGAMTLGMRAQGALTVESGGQVGLTGNLVLGINTGGGGIVTVDGGILNAGTAGVFIDSGIVTVESGGTLLAGDVGVGFIGGGQLNIGAGGVANVSSVTVSSTNASGEIDFSGGLLESSSAVAVSAGGTIQGFGTLQADVTLSATGINALGGTLEITGGISGSGTLDLGSGSTMLLDSAPGDTPTVTFANVGTETLVLANPSIDKAGAPGIFTAVTDVGVGDKIDFGSGIAINSISYAAVSGGQNVTLNVTEGVTTGFITLNDVQFGGGARQFNITTDAATGDAAIQAAPCFAAGTRIATARGEIAVEDLVIGDLVPTVLGETGETGAPIIWIGQRHVTCDRHPRPKQVWPVRIAAGAFGPGRPHTDLFLSPDHAIYVNEVLIPVRYLINDSSITQVPMDRVTYYHIELPQHDVVLAQGLPTESFLDMQDRSDYANRPGPIRLYPDFAVRMWEAFGCAPLIVTGPELEAARALIGSFAATQAAA